MGGERTRRGQTREEVDRIRAAPLDLTEAQTLPLGAQQYLAALVRTDPHNVSAIVPVPEYDGHPVFAERVWIHVQLMQLVRDLNVPWLLALQGTCTAQQPTCATMHVGSDAYLCPVHGDGRSCTALEYIQHALDAIIKQLASPQAFPPDAPIPHRSVRLFGAACKQIARVFLHIYHHHPALFAQCEASSALYARFRLLAERYALFPTDTLPVEP